MKPIPSTKRFPFPSYPNGWFAVAFSPEIAPGAVVTRRAFGQDIVVYRTESGAVAVTDPHCPHVGAHLGHGGRVVGETLRCPFHGWCFDGRGECVSIPGAAKIPPKAALRTWPVREQNGVIFVYHDSAGAPPMWEPPVLPDEGWTANRTILWTLRTHPQEVMENTVDQAHLVPIHGVDRATIVRQPSCDGHVMNVALNLIADGSIVGMPGTQNDVILDVTLHGLGHTVVESEIRNVGIRARQRIYCTPIDDERTEIRGVVNLQKLGDEMVSNQIAELFYQAFVIDFALDFPIWENKVYYDRPLLSSADGPFMVYRRWARQFYRDTLPFEKA
jgi:phenylpropionate dioxygenase-like ring-hydroxylating dioxygenase large terminal subunit